MKRPEIQEAVKLLLGDGMVLALGVMRQTVTDDLKEVVRWIRSGQPSPANPTNVFPIIK